MPQPLPKKILARKDEITADFMAAIEKHLDDVVKERVVNMFEIRDFAELLFIHPTHLSNTIKLTTGHSPCYFVEARIMDIARDMIQQNIPINRVAAILTFDPSNFTKFFKRFQGVTPKQYRESLYEVVG
ncbi:helix-turn-helix transcriptional regulator [Mucilaginibacter pallidiroseus]|uniref:Helix-turn-helix transcriptional regulator n=1 Tax=Mucilaginibacter pallidiroseus TaxID=2599295 RepID=A0A563U3B9_9SPHI|nr:AraC family transcriptional regulator [Mucilaginibacter pallidiroseus]TWR25825.1 helix-turn-helix transcriptional regulator [Mucilaginibacter pallidiroseus]